MAHYLLFNKKLIREISKETKYDTVIKMAIFAYDKNGFPADIDEKGRHMCAIIKDAHNLDSFRLFVNYPYVDTVIKSYPSSLVYDDFKSFKTISSKVSDNASDEVLVTLSKMYSDTGIIGKPLAALGIKVAYTHVGLVIALVFVGIPFVIRAVQPVLEKLDGQYEEAAFMLGANRFQTFRRVLLPEMMPPVLTGFGLAFARGIGEYGSVIYISGNSAREHTQVISYVIMQKLGYIDYASATAIALVMLILSFVLLLAVNIVQMKQAARTNNV